jgi:SAM-dependent methyltransferase
MPNNNVAFVGSIPENYDRYLGPVLFEPYAADIARRLNLPDDGSVLEIACGTGIVTRQLRQQLPPTVKIVATDLNEAMMNYARQKFGADENIEWRQADATELPFEDRSCDAVVCQFGLMFMPDKARAATEAFRVLKPGGRFAVSDVVVRGNVPADIRRSVELWVGCIAGALEEQEYATKLRAAGFADVEVEPWRIYQVEDARSFLTEQGIDVERLAPQVDGKFASAFVRARKPETVVTKSCCGPTCCAS